MKTKRLSTLLFTVITLLLLSSYLHAGNKADASYAVVNVSVVPLRAEGRFTSGMVTQALMGTPLKILNTSGWYHVETPDGYHSWAHRLTICPMTKQQFDSWNSSPKVVITAFHGFVYAQPDENSQHLSDVVAGCRLKLEEKAPHYFKISYPDGRVGYVRREIAKPLCEWRKGVKQDASSIIATAYQYLGIPYLWAGMSPKGVDCSGFVRAVLFQHDIIIPRDAWQQAAIGKRIPFSSTDEALCPGDLLFFGSVVKNKELISHVAIYLGNHRFIHSLGDVRIGSFNKNDQLYDAYNTGRRLFAVRFLPCLNKDDRIFTTDHWNGFK